MVPNCRDDDDDEIVAPLGLSSLCLFYPEAVGLHEELAPANLGSYAREDGLLHRLRGSADAAR